MLKLNKLFYCQNDNCGKSFYDDKKRRKHEINCGKRRAEKMREYTFKLPCSMIRGMERVAKENEVFHSRSDVLRYFIKNGLDGLIK